MLVPAVCYKEEIEKALGKYFYTDDMMYYTGWRDSSLIEVENAARDGRHQYAVTGNDGKLIGYLSYYEDYYSDCAYGFGAFSFDRGNPIMGREMFKLLEKLIQSKHRVEFRAVSGNPAIRGYDKFLEKHADIGKKLTLTDEFKDANGNYHDSYIYEFLGGHIVDLKSNKELNRHFEKLKRLRKLKEKEPDNTYHFWEKEIARCEHNIVDVVEEILRN